MKLQKLSFILLVLSFLSFGSCAKDPNPIIPRLTKYYALCPGGSALCYQNCGATYDVNGNGIIDPVEQPNYNGCTSICNTQCDLSFLYLLL